MVARQDYDATLLALTREEQVARAELAAAESLLTTHRAETVTLAESKNIQLLDQASAAGAATRTDWLDVGDVTVTSAVQLDPFTVAICNPAGPAELRADERSD